MAYGGNEVKGNIKVSGDSARDNRRMGGGSQQPFAYVKPPYHRWSAYNRGKDDSSDDGFSLSVDPLKGASSLAERSVIPESYRKELSDSHTERIRLRLYEKYPNVETYDHDFVQDEITFLAGE